MGGASLNTVTVSDVEHRPRLLSEYRGVTDAAGVPTHVVAFRFGDDPTTDLALLKIDAPTLLPSAPLGIPGTASLIR